MLQQEDAASTPRDKHDTKESKYDCFGAIRGGEEIKDKLAGGKYDSHYQELEKKIRTER